MYLRTIYLHHFRCYREASYTFSPGINVIFGPNARGKTSLLEAIHFLMTGRSFRTSQIEDLVQIGTSGFYLEAIFVKNEIEQTLKVYCEGKHRKVLYNNTVCPSLGSLLGLLQGVVVTPDDVSLVKGAPTQRRHFLDLQIAQIDPLYMHHLLRYNRAMKQRNTLLRAKSFATLESWEHEMANSAAYIVKQRHRATCDLEANGRTLYRLLSGETEDLNLNYKTNAGAGDDLDLLRKYHFDHFLKLRRREAEIGSTLVGPHKDDLTIGIGQKEARFFASEGQQRSCVAALRFAEWMRLNQLADDTPLMLMDDVGVSLDSSRRDRLMSHVKTLGQVFLTSTQELEANMKYEI